ncbi:MAG: hypothetical protein HZA91_12920 [Verrucomicrobia bacterium]|nr:hypothetical protein [Verrucomicrobiota bacterium]
MNSFKRLQVATFGLVLLAQAATLTFADPADSHKVRLAVIDLSTGDGITVEEGKMLTVFIRDAIVNSGRFEVMDRQRVADILKEQNFSAAFSDETTQLVKVGKLLDANRIVGGRVGRFGKNWSLVLSLVDVNLGTLISSYALPNAESKENLLKSAPRAGLELVDVAEFLRTAASLPPEQQVTAVIAKLKELNPGFDGKEQHKIEGGAVTEFSISTIGVSDISPLRALKRLAKLTIVPSVANQDGAVTDLSALQGLPLRWLCCHNNPITDLSPLKGMPLTVLSCSGTQASNLSPLRGMPLATLWCNNTRVTDLSPLRDMPLQELRCDFVAARDAAILRDIKTLARINDIAAATFWFRVGNVVPSQRTTSGTSQGSANEVVWSRAINLMLLIDLEKDAVKGKWTMQDGKLVSAPERHARIQIPFEPPEEYDFRIVFCRNEGIETVAQFISQAGRGAMWNMACDHGTAFGFDIVGGRPSNKNSTTYRPSTALKNGRVYSSVLQVRKNGVKAYLDGRLVSHWKTDYTDGGVSGSWQLPDYRLLGVGAYQAVVTFHKIELLEITGRGKPVRGSR